jgi:hypothetical protein
MLSFLRSQTFEDPLLGSFKRVRTMWYPENPTAGLGVTMEGGKERPPAEVVEVARRLLSESQAPIQLARAFLEADSRALEFMQGNGDLVCDGFTVYQSGSFAVEFSLSTWPDAMISVPFKEGIPCEVLLND